MTGKDLAEIKWTAAFLGFGVDLAFSLFVGSIVVAVMLGLKGSNPENGSDVPSDVDLASQIVGVIGASVGGVVAGFLAGRRGSLHGVLASVIGLIAFLFALLFLGSPPLNVGDLGFVVLNLVAAGYGGAMGERWRRRREADSRKRRQ